MDFSFSRHREIRGLNAKFAKIKSRSREEIHTERLPKIGQKWTPPASTFHEIGLRFTVDALICSPKVSFVLDLR
jgi:hypothetical protein